MTEARAGDRLKVVHFIDVLGAGGKERQLVELLKGFARAGNCDSHVVCMNHGVFYADLLSLPNTSMEVLERRWKFDPMPALRLWAVVRRHRPDAIVTWDFLTSVYALPAALTLGVRMVNHMIQDAPGTLPRRVRFGARLSFPFADLIVANSRAGLDAYGARGDRCRVIHNGFDQARLENLADPDDVRRRWNLGDGLIVGMVSTFRPWKDQPTFIRAAQQILRRRRDVVFVLVGDGETLASCRLLVDADCSERIVFTGAVSSGLESLVNVFDVGVLATFTEGIPNAVMEYMACGKAVVATDGGGTSELVVDGHTGFLVPPEDADRLATAVDRLLSDPALRELLGRAGRERVETAFSLERMVDLHREAYRA